MELTNDFTVAAPIGEAWPLLTDIERIAPCVPGFKLTGKSEDGEYKGTMKVKVGAVQTTYECVVRFVALDEEHHRAVMAASGKELRGQGGVTASITSTLTEEGPATHASVVTDLDVTGRVAQFGRGILADVSNRLVKQFVAKLESTMLSDGAAAGEQAADAARGPSAAAAPEPTTGPSAGGESEDEDEALNLLSVAGAPMVKRIVVPAVALILAALVVRALLRR